MDGYHQGIPGSPEHRLQRAARGLKAATTFVEHIAAEEGITMPIEVWRAVATIRQWTRSVGAVEPGPPVMPPRPRPE